jgi:autotransporter-associated beta strand protein
VVELTGGTLELSATTGAGTRLTGAAIVVDGNGMLAIRRTGSPGNHVTTGFDCPITIATSSTLAFDYRGAFSSPSLPPIRYQGTTTSTGTVTLEGDTTFAVTNTGGGTGEIILAGRLVAPIGAGFTKSGNQTLTFACGGTLSGATRVAEGTLRIAAPGVLSSSTVAVDGGATLAVATGALSSAVLVANNLRDIPTDAVAGKVTLAVRLGDTRTRVLYQSLLALAGVLTIALMRATPWCAIGLLAAPLALRAAGPVRRGQGGRDLIPVLRDTGLTMLVWSVAVAAALVLHR